MGRPFFLAVYQQDQSRNGSGGPVGTPDWQGGGFWGAAATKGFNRGRVHCVMRSCEHEC